MADKSIKITIATALNAAGFTATKRAFSSLVSGTRDFAAKVGGNLMNIKAGFDMICGSAARLASFAGKALKTSFKFEKSHTDFTGLLNSVDAAKKHIEDLRKFASSTPLTFDDLSSASKLLLSFGMSVEDVMPSMRMLGDIAMGDSQKFKGLALVFAQVKSAGKLMGQDLLQMINQGFNPLTVIAKETGKSVSELKDIMSKGGITFEIVEEAMRKATAEGGLFNDAMKNASTTGEGLVSTLGDKWADVVRTFGNAFSEAAKGGLSELIEKITELTNDGSIERWANKSYDAFVKVMDAAKSASERIAQMVCVGERNSQGAIMSALGGIGAGLAEGSEYGGGWRGFRKAQAAYLALHSSNESVAEENAKRLSDMMNADGEWSGFVDIRKEAAKVDAEEHRDAEARAKERAAKAKADEEAKAKAERSASAKSMTQMLDEAGLDEKSKKALDKKFDDFQRRVREAQYDAWEFIDAYEKDAEDAAKEAAKTELKERRDALKLLHDERMKQIDDELAARQREIDAMQQAGAGDVMPRAGGGAWGNGAMDQAGDERGRRQRAKDNARMVDAETNLVKKMIDKGATLDDPSKLGRLSNLEKAALERMQLARKEAEARRLQKERDERERQMAKDLDDINRKLANVGL